MAHKARKNLTCVDYAIRGESKRTTEITELLGVQPTCAFDEGDTYPSHELVDGVVRPVIRERASNVWHYSSEGLVQSGDINEHLAFVLAALEPAAGRIALLMQDQGLQPGVYLWNVDDLGFIADSPLLLTLAGITSWVAVRCWPEEDDGDEPDAGASAKTPSWLADKTRGIILLASARLLASHLAPE